MLETALNAENPPTVTIVDKNTNGADLIAALTVLSEVLFKCN